MTEQTPKNIKKGKGWVYLILGAFVIVCGCIFLLIVFGSSGSRITTIPTLDIGAVETAATKTAWAKVNSYTNTPIPSTTDLPTISAANISKPRTPIPAPSETPDPYVYLYKVGSLIFLDHDSYNGNGRGIKVYMGEQNTYIFEIIGGGSCPSMPSGQGYLVRYPNGNEVWKDRRAMEQSGLFVDNDAFTLYARDWKVYYNCP